MTKIEDYEAVLKFIATTMLELSHEKVALQRDDFVRRARYVIEKHASPAKEPRPELNDDF